MQKALQGAGLVAHAAETRTAPAEAAAATVAGGILLGDLLYALSSGNFLLFLSYVVMPQWLIHFTRYPQQMKQGP